VNESLDVGGSILPGRVRKHSQVSRKYSRLFGAPPLRDIMLLPHYAAIYIAKLLKISTCRPIKKLNLAVHISI
jgi:hypothetical protein